MSRQDIYLKVYRDMHDDLWVSEENCPFPSGDPSAPKPLHTYELRDDGSLVEWHEPERMFACQGHKGDEIAAPGAMSEFTFNSDLNYFEVMPETGDYRRVHDDELAKLRVQAKP